MSAETQGAKPAPQSSYRIPEGSPWANAWKVSAVLGVLGAVAAAVGYFGNPHRFAFSYMFAFVALLTVGLGALFFVISLHLTLGAWGVTLRRIGEFLLTGVPVLALLFLPVLAQMNTIFSWLPASAEHPAAATAEHASPPTSERDGASWLGVSTAHAQLVQEQPELHPPASVTAGTSPEEAHEAHVMRIKRPYLSLPFFLGRAIFYFGVWIMLALAYFRWSTHQDSTRSTELTVKMQKLAPAGTILFGLTLTFAGFDWIMSLMPGWYSTIFGVYVFSGCAVTGYALVTLIALGLHSRGHFGNAVTVEHFHDIGKLLFGFICFWAYAGFAQWMLIWYAGIPEETTFFHLRWESQGWKAVSILLMVGHFALPFFFLISRVPKRRLAMLGFGAAWMLVMHLVDVYWLVIPNATAGVFAPHWMDAACLLAVGGAFFAVVFWQMQRHPLIPVGDPRLLRSVVHVQTT